ncbi:MAG: transcription antitermination factor NusB [Sphingomonadales bacterium]
MVKKAPATGSAGPARGGPAPPNPSPRSSARLGAVQALYQHVHNPDVALSGLVGQFKRYRLNKVVDGVLMAEADAEFFTELLKGIEKRWDELQKLVAGALSEKWSHDRLETIIKAILTAGTYELVARPDIPTAVVINEYLDIAHAFLDSKEVGFINGVLDRLAREVRS